MPLYSNHEIVVHEKNEYDLITKSSLPHHSKESMSSKHSAVTPVIKFVEVWQNQVIKDKSYYRLN